MRRIVWFLFVIAIAIVVIPVWFLYAIWNWDVGVDVTEEILDIATKIIYHEV